MSLDKRRAEFQRWFASVQSRPVAAPVTESADYAASVASGCAPALSPQTPGLFAVYGDEKLTCTTQLRRDAPNTRHVGKTFMEIQ
jgi:hypothetical protein